MDALDNHCQGKRISALLLSFQCRNVDIRLQFSEQGLARQFCPASLNDIKHTSTLTWVSKQVLSFHTQVLPEDERLSKWTLSTHQFGRDWEFSWISQNMTPIPLQKIHWRSVQVSIALYGHMTWPEQCTSCDVSMLCEGAAASQACACVSQDSYDQRMSSLGQRSCTLQGSSGGSLGSSIDIANRGQIRFYRKSATTCTVKLTISYEVPPVLAPVAGALTPIVESILSTDLKRFANLAAQEPLQA